MVRGYSIGVEYPLVVLRALGMHTGCLLAVRPSVCLFSSLIYFLGIWKDHFLYTFTVKTFCTCSTSSSTSTGSDATVSALHSMVWTNNLLCSRWWLESQFRYWSGCVGIHIHAGVIWPCFLYSKKTSRCNITVYSIVHFTVTLTMSKLCESNTQEEGHHPLPSYWWALFVMNVQLK